MAVKNIDEWLRWLITPDTKLPEDQFPNTRITPLKVDLGSQPLDRYAASQAAMSGKHWHELMLRQVGSWVAKCNIDEEIKVLAAAQTLPGYTIEQTAVEVQKMIVGARSKGFDKSQAVRLLQPLRCQDRS